MLPPSEEGTRCGAGGGGRGRITVASPSGSKAPAGGTNSVRSGAISMRCAGEPGFGACDGRMRVASSSSSMLIDSLRFLAFRLGRRNAEHVEDVGPGRAGFGAWRRHRRLAEGDGLRCNLEQPERVVLGRQALGTELAGLRITGV